MLRGFACATPVTHVSDRASKCHRVCFSNYGGLLVHSLYSSVFLSLLCLAVQTVVGIGETEHFVCTFSAILVRLAVALAVYLVEDSRHTQ